MQGLFGDDVATLDQIIDARKPVLDVQLIARMAICRGYGKTKTFDDRRNDIIAAEHMEAMLRPLEMLGPVYGVATSQQNTPLPLVYVGIDGTFKKNHFFIKK